MTRPVRGAWLAPFLVAGLLATAGCSPPPPDSPNILRWGDSDEPRTLNLVAGSTSNEQTLAKLITDPLVHLDKDLNVVPALAESWAWSDDGLTLTFTLASGRTWHDGRPVRASDVVESVARFRELNPSGLAFFADVNVVAPDDRTVVVAYPAPFGPAEVNWTQVPIFPQHVSADADPPVGCGPWMFERWDRGERVVLSANDKHPTAPKIARLSFDLLEDYSLRYSALKSGDIDVAGISPAVWAQAREDREFLDAFDVHEYTVLFYWYIAWRMDGSNPFFADQRVRQAMSHAIDRAGYVAHANGGDIVGVTSFHPGLWATDESLRPWAYDPQRARDLLTQAGWVDRDGDGVREKNGQPFRFSLLYNARSSTDQIAQIVQANLADVGVDMQLGSAAGPVVTEKRRQRDFEAFMSGQRLDPDPDQYDIWHSRFAHEGGFNHAGLQDPQIDAWLEQARQLVDRDERTQIYRLVQQRLHELQPNTIFFYPTSRLAVRSTFENVELSSVGALGFRPGVAGWQPAGRN